MPRLFVYGTLKRSCKNHHHLTGQRFIGEARTAPGYRLYHLGNYPGMVADTTDTNGVTGEVWDVDAAALSRLDEFEGINEGLYHRVRVELLAPFNHDELFTYLYARDPGNRAIGSTWHERTA